MAILDITSHVICYHRSCSSHIVPHKSILFLSEVYLLWTCLHIYFFFQINFSPHPAYMLYVTLACIHAVYKINMPDWDVYSLTNRQSTHVLLWPHRFRCWQSGSQVWSDLWLCVERCLYRWWEKSPGPKSIDPLSYWLTWVCGWYFFFWD